MCLIKAFANLSKEQLREELRIRGVFDLSGKKTGAGNKTTDIVVWVCREFQLCL